MIGCTKYLEKSCLHNWWQHKKEKHKVRDYYLCDKLNRYLMHINAV